jgi:hypothetical protein
MIHIDLIQHVAETGTSFKAVKFFSFKILNALFQITRL